MTTVKSYRDLDTWQVGMDVVEKTYRLTALFPDTERVRPVLADAAGGGIGSVERRREPRPRSRPGVPLFPERLDRIDGRTRYPTRSRKTPAIRFRRTVE